MKTWVIVGLLVVMLTVVGVYIYANCDTDVIEGAFARIKSSISSVGYKIKIKFEE